MRVFDLVNASATNAYSQLNNSGLAGLITMTADSADLVLGREFDFVVRG